MRSREITLSKRWDFTALLCLDQNMQPVLVKFNRRNAAWMYIQTNATRLKASKSEFSLRGAI